MFWNTFWKIFNNFKYLSNTFSILLANIFLVTIFRKKYSIINSLKYDIYMYNYWKFSLFEKNMYGHKNENVMKYKNCFSILVAFKIRIMNVIFDKVKKNIFFLINFWIFWLKYSIKIFVTYVWIVLFKSKINWSLFYFVTDRVQLFELQIIETW